MEDAQELDVREYAHADVLVAAAAAAASSSRDGTVTLTNLRVTHRKRRGKRQFWVTAAPPAGGLEVHMSFRRADLDDGRREEDVTMLWETDAHAVAFEAATPGALKLHTLELAGAALCSTKLSGQLAEEPAAAQRRSAQRRAIGAFAAVLQSLSIAHEHLKPCEQVVAESDGLGSLQMGEARHHRLGVQLRLVQQRVEQRVRDGRQLVDLIAQVQAYDSRNLVIAGASGVQFFTDNANALG